MKKQFNTPRAELLVLANLDITTASLSKSDNGPQNNLGGDVAARVSVSAPVVNPTHMSN